MVHDVWQSIHLFCDHRMESRRYGRATRAPPVARGRISHVVFGTTLVGYLLSLSAMAQANTTKSGLNKMIMMHAVTACTWMQHGRNDTRAVTARPRGFPAKCSFEQKDVKKTTNNI